MDKPSSGGSRRLTRQTSSRLQMHAPSSLKVAHADAADVAGWNAAIPLLSPLDAASRAWDVAAEHEHRQEERRRQPTAATTSLPPPLTVETKRETTAAATSAWKHPAAPFYYEPAPPGAGPGFLLSLT